MIKMVNGQEVELTAEQEAAVRADWDLGKANNALEAEARVQETTDKASAKSKLEALGLTSDEVSAIT